MPRICKLLAVWTVLATLSSCGGGEAGGDTTVVTVAAASSLTDAFEALADAFEADHPGVEVRLTFASSTTLATQVLEGASVDVLATADAEAMAPVVDAGLAAGDPQPFAGNQLVGVTRAGAPSPFEGDGLGDGDVLALCAPDAPCGRLADEHLAELVPRGAPADDQITRAPNARATLAAVVDGDATAAVVYATDAASAGDAVEVHELAFDRDGPDTTYPIVALAEASDPELARAFVDAVRSDEGQALLDEQGFVTARDGWER